MEIIVFLTLLIFVLCICIFFLFLHHENILHNSDMLEIVKEEDLRAKSKMLLILKTAI